LFRKTIPSLVLFLLVVSMLAVAVKVQPASPDSVNWLRGEAVQVSAGGGISNLPMRAVGFKLPVASAPEAAEKGTSMGLDEPLVLYDEQLGFCFGQNSTNLAYNVTAVQQEDSYGYGPAYLLNAYTDAGYWYQVGLYYNWLNTDWVEWPSTTLSNVTGFGLGYEVWDNKANSVYPTDGGGGLDSFNGTVNAGDNVLLALYLSSGNVTMYAYDWKTGASAQETYTAVGASLFIGATQGPSGDLMQAPWVYFFGPGYFTGLMTEWVHPNAYYGGEGRVVYQNSNSTLQLGYIWAGEQVLSNWTTTGILFYNGQQVTFPPPYTDELQNFTTSGAAEAVSGYLFITGEPTVDASPDSVVMDVGQSQLFASTVWGGVSPYTYQWYLDGSAVSGATDANWTFTPTSTGSYTVYVIAIDSVGAQATSNSADVTVNIHDVALTSLSSSKTFVGQGYDLNLSVAASNLGNYTETFNLKIYANATNIASQNVTLPSGNSTNANFTWNTTSFAYGHYTITATAEFDPSENATTNNCTCSAIVTIPGDINGDFKVNMQDIALVARAFGSDGPNYLHPGSPPSANWNPNADINNDGIVNMKDVALVARNFGQHYP